MDTPKSIGEPVGVVISGEKESFTIDSGENLNPGDGICFFDSDKNLRGTNVNSVCGRKIKVQNSDALKPGVFVFRNFDKKFTDQLDSSKTNRKIRIEISLVEDEDEKITRLTAVDEEKIKASVIWPDSGEIVQNAVRFEEILKTNLSKLGNTEFYCEKVDIKLKDHKFCRVSEINSLRRDLIEKLREEREKLYQREVYSHENNENSSETKEPFCPEKEIDYRGNVLNRSACNFYLKHGVEKVEHAAETGLNMVDLPIMKNRYCLKYEMKICPKQNPKTKDLSFIEPFYLIDEAGAKFRIQFDCKSCGMSIYLT